MFKEMAIEPTRGRRGPWQYEQYTCCGDGCEGEEDLIDVLFERIGEDIFELTDDADLPDGLPDIRGRIEQQAGQIFGWLDKDGVPHYFAVVLTADLD